jgi:hypothetical protein
MSIAALGIGDPVHVFYAATAPTTSSLHDPRDDLPGDAAVVALASLIVGSLAGTRLAKPAAGRER